MKIIFLGSSDFAVVSLEALLESHDIAAVFTQPDRRKGRHLTFAQTPVKVFSIQKNIPVFQPHDINTPQSMESLMSFDADLFVVVSFGQKLSNEVLNIPKQYCINVHASVLPQLRGASPINSAIVNGDEISGVTIMKMAQAMDAGDMIFQKEIPIEESDNALTLHAKLSVLGAQALLESVKLIEKDKVAFIKQDESLVTFARKLKKEQGLIDWQQPARAIHNKVRGLLPWPCAFTYYQEKFLKILKTTILTRKTKHVRPGEIVGIEKHKGIIIATATTDVLIEELQLEGKKTAAAYDFVLGHKVQPGDMLGKRNRGIGNGV